MVTRGGLQPVVTHARFTPLDGGNRSSVLGLAIALIVIGLIAGFLAGPLGFVGLIVGLILLVVYFVGAGRRATDR